MLGGLLDQGPGRVNFTSRAEGDSSCDWETPTPYNPTTCTPLNGPSEVIQICLIYRFLSKYIFQCENQGSLRLPKGTFQEGQLKLNMINFMSKIPFLPFILQHPPSARTCGEFYICREF